MLHAQWEVTGKELLRYSHFRHVVARVHRYRGVIRVDSWNTCATVVLPALNPIFGVCRRLDESEYLNKR